MIFLLLMRGGKAVANPVNESRYYDSNEFLIPHCPMLSSPTITPSASLVVVFALWLEFQAAG